MQPYGDAVTKPYWDAARRRELTLQRCSACGRFQHYPRRMCVHCGGRELTWERASGRGTVHSATTIHLQVLEHLPAPYQLLLVDLDEGVRLLSRTQGEDCAIGDRVVVAWEEREDLPPLPVFTRAKDA